MIALGAILAIMPSRLAGASLETRIDEVGAAMPAAGFAVPAAGLAEWLTTGKPLALVDVREHWEYDEFHLEGAAHVALDALLSTAGIKAVPADRPIVLVGRGDAAAGQAAAILRLAGREAYALEGGIGAWWRDVLTPASADPSIPRAERPSAAAQRVAWRRQFLGAAAAGTATATTAPAPGTAKPAAPAPSRPKSGATRGKGC